MQGSVRVPWVRTVTACRCTTLRLWPFCALSLKALSWSGVSVYMNSGSVTKPGFGGETEARNATVKAAQAAHAGALSEPKHMFHIPNCDVCVLKLSAS